jgi:hypothetical protein
MPPSLADSDSDSARDDCFDEFYETDDEAEEDGKPIPVPADVGQLTEKPPKHKNLDTWKLVGNTLQRIHRTPRYRLFYPTEKNCPIPVEYLDILRRTQTDLRDKSESQVEDFWYDNADKTGLSQPWIGKTVFHLLHPKADKGMVWVDGRQTRKQKTTRPDSIWPEMWPGLSEKQKQIEIEKWKIEGPLREAARKKRCIFELPEGEGVQNIIKAARNKLDVPVAAAMPLVAVIKQNRGSRS